MLKSADRETQNIDALENVILMILQDNPMCKIRINALVFEIDKQTFLQHGYKLTGSTYIRKWNGPMISNLDEVLDRMCQEEKIALKADCKHCEMNRLCSKLA